MKKIISMFMTLVMLASVCAVSAFADGKMHVQSDFSTSEGFTRDFHAGAFYPDDDGAILGYSEAKCLQTKGEWFVFDTAIDVAIGEDEIATGDRAFTVCYPNTNLMNWGHRDSSYYMNFIYDIAKKEVSLTGGSIGYSESNDVIVEPVVYEGISDTGMSSTVFGISVERQRIRCFINGEMVLSFYDAEDQYLIGLEDDDMKPTAICYWNDNNFIKVNDVKIATPGYLFPEVDTPPVTSVPADVTTAPADNTDPVDVTTPADSVTDPADVTGGNENNAPADTSVTTTATSIVDVTDDKGDIVTNEAGEKVTSAVIVTEKPAVTTTAVVQVTDEKGEAVTNEAGEQVTSVITNAPSTAATNNNRPQGGNATQTGDATFAVIAAMIVALGSAVIVKKVTVK